MFKLLSFLHLYLLLLFSCVWICEREVHYILYTSTSVSPSVVVCCCRSAILDFGNSKFLTVWPVKLPILHNYAKFREDRSIRCCGIAIFVVYQDGDRRHVVFWKIQNFNGLSPVGGKFASPCQISLKAVKWLLRYDDLTVFFQMAAVRHLGFWKFKFF